MKVLQPPPIKIKKTQLLTQVFTIKNKKPA